MSQSGGPRVYVIAAVAANGIIGRHGQLPWHLPEDLKHFKQATLGCPVIMGRRTWESIGRPLPGRKNVVVTRSPGFAAPGAELARSLGHAIELCRGADKVFVIGGTSLFREGLACADGLILTEIGRDYGGDTSFPDFDRARWRELERRPHEAADGTRMDFVTYARR